MCSFDLFLGDCVTFLSLWHNHGIENVNEPLCLKIDLSQGLDLNWNININLFGPEELKSQVLCSLILKRAILTLSNEISFNDSD